MLMQLTVKDFALIDQIVLTLDARLNVLTGETGAGKSIIIDAVSLLLGARAKSDDVRIGCQKALIEGVFTLEHPHIIDDTLANLGLMVEEDDVLLLSREIAATGKNICRINNRIVTLGNFKEVGHQLINIYGQHDFQAISNKENHIELVDSLGSQSFKRLKAQVRESYHYVSRAKKALLQMKNQVADRNERLDFLRYKVRELDELALNAGEDEQLEQELIVLENLEKIVESSTKSYRMLYGDNNSVYALLNKTINQLGHVVEYDEQLVTMVEDLQSMVYTIEDDALTLSKYDDRLDYDPVHKEQLEERKYALDKVKKKYGLSIEDILEEYQKLQQEISTLENSEFEMMSLKENYQKVRREFLEKAEILSQERQKIAQGFEQQLMENLADLAMSDAKFQVRFTKGVEQAKGIDEVEFYISPNPGQPLRALSQIASGGEMSRIMLAFKTILAKYESIDTLIFDEIDTGIGGNIVVMVADKLSKVSRAAQVICVTHAPQIAAQATKHFKITKHVEEGQTITGVFNLDEDQQIREIARMLGGEAEFQLKHAKELKKMLKND